MTAPIMEDAQTVHVFAMKDMKELTVLSLKEWMSHAPRLALLSA